MKKKNKEYKDALPNEIRVLFGKFYVFSFILILFLGIIFPFLLVDNISLFSEIGILVFLFAFYVYVVIDVIKKKKSFTSTIFVLLIVLVLMCFIACIIKLII